jgi:hypothetical protein
MKPHRLVVVLVVVLLATSAAAALVPTDQGVDATEQRATVTLTVTVTDNFNNGIANAKLTAFWDGGQAEATTASNGKAFVDVEEGADVRIFVNHSSYTQNNPTVVESATEQDVGVKVFRKANAEVTAVSDGAAIENARVVLTKEGQDRAAARGRTGSDGVFTSGTIEQGTYEVSVVKPGFLRNTTTVDVRDTTETEVAIAVGSATVTFSVTDDHFEDPRAVEDATVQVQGPTSGTFNTSGSGTVQFGLPVNAEYTVTVTKDGHETVQRTVSVGEQSRRVDFTINREPALSVEAVNQRVVVGERVQVTATDEYGERAGNATVLVDGEEVGTTDADGTFQASIESAGEHTITVQKDGASAAVTVEGVDPDADEATPTESATATATGTDAPIGDFAGPNLVMKVGVAAVGVLLALFVVRRLL